MKIILWLLHPDPVSRATLHDLEHNKWVNQEIDISLYSFETVLEGNDYHLNVLFNLVIITVNSYAFMYLALLILTSMLQMYIVPVAY